MLIGRGVFSPGAGHVMHGSFTLTRQDGNTLMKTSSDFFFDGSPEPDWAFFAPGIPMEASDPDVRRLALETRFGSMPRSSAVSGVQTGVVPPSVNIREFDTLFLWCFQIPFILGTAEIEHL